MILYTSQSEDIPNAKDVACDGIENAVAAPQVTPPKSPFLFEEKKNRMLFPDFKSPETVR